MYNSKNYVTMKEETKQLLEAFKDKDINEMDVHDLKGYCMALREQNEQQRIDIADYEGSFDNLNDQIADLTTKEKAATTGCNREYRKVTILKGALKLLKEKYSITDGDYYAALVSGGNGELDIDTLLYQLSK